MKISKRQAWLLAVMWAIFAMLATMKMVGFFWGVAVFSGLLSIACAVQFDPE